MYGMLVGQEQQEHEDIDLSNQMGDSTVSPWQTLRQWLKKLLRMGAK